MFRQPLASPPKTLPCPHCGGQIHFVGRGRVPTSIVYHCPDCVAMLRLKELWPGQIVRTGNRGFGFAQLQGFTGWGTVYFNMTDLVDTTAVTPAIKPARVGDPVLVLLGKTAQRAERVWRMDRATSSRFPDCRGQQNVRRQGIVTTMKDPLWGFITEQKTGQAYFVHQRDVCDGLLAVGQHVTFLPAQTPKGRKACELRIVRQF